MKLIMHSFVLDGSLKRFGLPIFPSYYLVSVTFNFQGEGILRQFLRQSIPSCAKSTNDPGKIPKLSWQVYVPIYNSFHFCFTDSNQFFNIQTGCAICLVQCRSLALTNPSLIDKMIVWFTGVGYYLSSQVLDCPNEANKKCLRNTYAPWCKLKWLHK